MSILTRPSGRELLSKKTDFDSSCAVPTVLDIIGGKWAVLIIYSLSQGTKRYGEIQKQVKSISPKMLIQNLRQLETYGLVSRHVYAVVPPQVEYSLTYLGESLVDPLSLLYQWSVNHVQELKQNAQESHDSIPATEKFI
jgi:DNA-binding HxlR family transcriptional regulator